MFVCAECGQRHERPGYCAADGATVGFLHDGTWYFDLAGGPSRATTHSFPDCP
jgi:hypothetical protein